MEINAYVEFEKIVQGLAASEKPLKERVVESMASRFHFIDERHVPAAFRDEFRWLKEAVLKPDFSGQQPENLVSRVVTLAFQLAAAGKSN